ncbi:MAG: hypothetical protein KDK97_12660 [Verrucomicrobiales bacterium]|nr:hypothetical protein [Verrucomicrobiales bacterium]MCP5560316.1 hypothetical protein [Verrucomicrobiaceae bacterium]
MANLSPDQKQQVESWAADGASLNEIQDRIRTEFGITLTYMDARLLMIDMEVKLKEKARPPQPVAEPEPSAPVADDVPDAEFAEDATTTPTEQPFGPPPEGGTISVTVDQITIPGTMVSGKVTFSDGVLASWYVDQFGRLGLNASQDGYKPPPADIPAFQRELDRLLR